MDTTLITAAESPTISVVIPCYNSGAYLGEAVASVREYQGPHSFEVLIVDDGSTEMRTLMLLATLEVEGCTVLRQENKGPASARNTGARASRGRYLVFLDSDNRLRPEYFDLGVPILDADPTVGVVHGRARFFGDSTEPRFYPQPFNLAAILIGNYIDMCSMIRRQLYHELNGLDEERILIGHEDWEFWLRVGITNWRFHYIDQVLFDYRIRRDSLVADAGQEQKLNLTKRYVFNKHIELFIRQYKIIFNKNIDLTEQYGYYKHDKNKPFHSFVKYLYHKIKHNHI